MVTVFKSVRCTLEDYEIYEALIKQLGACKIPLVKYCKMYDVIGLQAYDGNTWLGKTLLLTPCDMHYDKWGFPVYRFKRYTGRTKITDYNNFKSRHLAGYNDFQ